MDNAIPKVFDTEKRVRLGIWGLGRGRYFISMAKAVNIDIVAGCDFNEVMRDDFRKLCPDAFVTADEDEFLAQDFDAVLVATFLTNHTRDTIKALKAGKHVMCEVTPFFTPAEGVELVEAVERSGKVYQLLENYPFFKPSLYIHNLWEKGVFGDFMYAEFNYVHECRALVYSYINGVPIRPGWRAHAWRSWLNSHYYNTHSLGPVMFITGTRPVAVTAMDTPITLPGYLRAPADAKGLVDKSGVSPSLIRMSNGGIVRNLMGATTGNSHDRRIWGTKAFADLTDEDDIRVRVGGAGSGDLYTLHPKMDEVWQYAHREGRGGGDFWTLYFFAREVLFGEKGPWDVYSACDVTLAGIQALRSCGSGRTEEVPDFRDPAVRDRYRHDDFRQAHFDPARIFPDGHDESVTGEFTTLMAECYGWGGRGDNLTKLRRARDGMRLAAEFATPADHMKLIKAVRELIAALPGLAETYRKLRRIQRLYPDCPAGHAIDSVLAAGDEAWVLDTDAALAELRAFLEKGPRAD